jgi:hypothetical protein
MLTRFSAAGSLTDVLMVETILWQAVAFAHCEHVADLQEVVEANLQTVVSNNACSTCFAVYRFRVSEASFKPKYTNFNL